MTSTEVRAALGLASVVGLRMLGLFIVLPVFTLLAAKLQGANPVLVGLALGIYGLTQARMQIPMGICMRQSSMLVWRRSLPCGCLVRVAMY